MRIAKLQSGTIFKNNNQNQAPKKREFIDKFTDAIKDPRDINDCIAVPRGIFKAYLLIMFGSGALAIGNLMPAKWKFLRTATIAAGWILNTLSAWFFAKGFAVKGLNPTLNRDEFKKQNEKA